MRGKKKIHKSQLKADPKYGSTVIAKFINYLMEKGKKSVAQAIVYKALEYVSSNTKQDALDVFDKAVKNVAPAMEVKSRRIGGANYQIPVAVRGDRRNALVFRWIINAARVRKGKPMYLKLGEEIIAAAENRGDAIKKKEDVQRMAEANRAFAHFAR
ncbi:30S ribosomal protein S7 [Patescibacteria group bacterium]|nr:30S ribosomal protein S7 [Patescibacteria group bacterium]MBU1922334.1 30S ribosomal protein S7 [Patescibacteria group bacterium]